MICIYDTYISGTAKYIPFVVQTWLVFSNLVTMTISLPPTPNFQKIQTGNCTCLKFQIKTNEWVLFIRISVTLNLNCWPIRDPTSENQHCMPAPPIWFIKSVRKGKEASNSQSWWSKGHSINPVNFKFLHLFIKHRMIKIWDACYMLVFAEDHSRWIQIQHAQTVLLTSERIQCCLNDHEFSFLTTRLLILWCLMHDSTIMYIAM